MVLERRVKKAVKDLLTKYADHVWTNWPVPYGYGAPMLDCIGAAKGRAFAIETKAPGERLTPRQQFTAEQMRRGGVEVFIIGESYLPDGAFSGMAELERWLDQVTQ